MLFEFDYFIFAVGEIFGPCSQQYYTCHVWW